MGDWAGLDEECAALLQREDALWDEIVRMRTGELQRRYEFERMLARPEGRYGG